MTVEQLLEIDAEYRRRSSAGELKLIAPRKHNPEGKAWLPIMTVDREGTKVTAVFSNTDRAHELGKTGEWVVVYYEKDGNEERCTVVTESRGDLKGKRVIRGREPECAEYYSRIDPGS